MSDQNRSTAPTALQIQAYDLKLRGHTWKVVGQVLGVSQSTAQRYFRSVEQYLEGCPSEADAFEAELQALVPKAWAVFHRRLAEGNLQAADRILTAVGALPPKDRPFEDDTPMLAKTDEELVQMLIDGIRLAAGYDPEIARKVRDAVAAEFPMDQAGPTEDRQADPVALIHGRPPVQEDERVQD